MNIELNRCIDALAKCKGEKFDLKQQTKTIIRLLKETLERGDDVDNLKGSIENIIKMYE